MNDSHFGGIWLQDSIGNIKKEIGSCNGKDWRIFLPEENAKRRMGNLLRLLTREEPPEPQVFLDFENAQPTAEEKEVYYLVESVLEHTEAILKDMSQYKGAGPDIREAIANPKSVQHQERAWKSVCPSVAKLRRCYEFSLQLETCIPRVLSVLTSDDMTPLSHLERQQALARQMALTLDFVLKFDELKMTTPSMQNDFAYYRRVHSMHSADRLPDYDLNGEAGDEGTIPPDVTNKMSYFYAAATPMLKVLCDTTTRFIAANKHIPRENTTDCLAAMAIICRKMVQVPEYCSRLSEEALSFCLRVMVGVVILYDHVHPVGAFTKTSAVDIKSCVKVLKAQPAAKSEHLLNALRYTTKHFNDDDTPKNIKQLMAV